MYNRGTRFLYLNADTKFLNRDLTVTHQWITKQPDLLNNTVNILIGRVSIPKYLVITTDEEVVFRGLTSHGRGDGKWDGVRQTMIKIVDIARKPLWNEVRDLCFFFQSEVRALYEIDQEIGYISV